MIALSSASLWQSFLMADRCFLSDFAVYLGLAGAAFLAATILPAQSELGLAVLIQSQDYALIWLLVAASLGNIAGAVVKNQMRSKKSLPQSAPNHLHAFITKQRYGMSVTGNGACSLAGCLLLAILLL